MLLQPSPGQIAFGALGSSYFNLSQKDSSFHYFEKALTLNPEDEQVLNNYAYFYSLVVNFTQIKKLYVFITII